MKQVGVITAAELQGGGTQVEQNKGIDWASPTTWATIFVIVAIAYLMIG